MRPLPSALTTRTRSVTRPAGPAQAAPRAAGQADPDPARTAAVEGPAATDRPPPVDQADRAAHARAGPQPEAQPAAQDPAEALGAGDAQARPRPVDPQPEVAGQREVGGAGRAEGRTRCHDSAVGLDGDRAHAGVGAKVGHLLPITEPLRLSRRSAKLVDVPRKKEADPPATILPLGSRATSSAPLASGKSTSSRPSREKPCRGAATVVADDRDAVPPGGPFGLTGQDDPAVGLDRDSRGSVLGRLADPEVSSA